MKLIRIRDHFGLTASGVFVCACVLACVQVCVCVCVCVMPCACVVDGVAKPARLLKPTDLSRRHNFDRGWNGGFSCLGRTIVRNATRANVFCRAPDLVEIRDRGAVYCMPASTHTAEKRGAQNGPLSW